MVKRIVTMETIYKKKWHKFISQNKYTLGLSQTDQGIIIPPAIQFRSDHVAFLEKILWCLSEYEQRLLALLPRPIAKLSDFPKLASLSQTTAFQEPDPEFDEEVNLSTNTEQYLAQLLGNVRKYKAEFSRQIMKEYISKSSKSFERFPAEAKE